MLYYFTLGKLLSINPEEKKLLRAIIINTTHLFLITEEV